MGFLALISHPKDWQATCAALDRQANHAITFWSADEIDLPAGVCRYTPQTFAAALQPDDIVFHCRGEEFYADGSLALVQDAFAQNDGLALVYGDSRVRGTGHNTYRPEQICRPPLAPFFLGNYNYISDCGFLRGSFLLAHPEVLDTDFGLSNYGALLALAAAGAGWRYLPEVLLQEDELFVRRDNRRVQADCRLLARRQSTPGAQLHEEGARFRFSANHNATVTVLAPLPEEFTPTEYLRMLQGRTGYRNVRFLLLTAPRPLPQDARLPLRLCDRVTAEAFDEAARAAGSDYLIFLNARVLPRQQTWIERLLDVLVLQGAGAASPLVTYPDINIAHAGMQCDGSAVLAPSFESKLYSRVEDLFYNQTDLRECATVCPYGFAVRREDFLAMGGFSGSPEDLPSAFADFGLKLRQSGKSCVYTPQSYLVTDGTATLDAAALLCRWGALLTQDPFLTDAMRQKYCRREQDWRILCRRAPHILPAAVPRIALLADGADSQAALASLAALRAQWPDAYCCLFTATVPAADLQPDDRTDILYNARLLLGSDGAAAFVAEFDRIVVASPLYGELLKQLTAVRDRLVAPDTLPLPTGKAGYCGVNLVQSSLAAPLPEEPIDVVVPVYNGYDYLERLFACIPRTEMPFRLLIVNDCSPDERVLPLLQRVAAQIPNTQLLQNDKNLGFVQSVNRALRLTKGHVAIVNTDVELPGGWLERLMTPILLARDVASSTPFTNSGTICSFPNFAENNEIFWGGSVEWVDSGFRDLQPDYYELPSGVGFCMGMSRYALDAVGVLDAVAFEKGYGEENDWCLRARARGFKNVLVNNLFVYHKHGGSFIPEEKQRLIQNHLHILSERYPFYDYEVGTFLEKDPYRAYRNQAAVRLSLEQVQGAESYLTFNWAGGAVAYLNQQRKEILQKGGAYLAVIYDETSASFWLDFAKGDRQYTAKGLTAEEAFDALRQARPVSLTINELVSYPDLPGFLGRIAAFKQETGTFLRMLVHDFFCLCPSYTLLDNHYLFCGLPAPEECRRCAACNTHFAALPRDIDGWRAAWGALLEQCDEVVCFSQDSRNHVRHIYPAVDPVVRPHTVTPLPAANPAPNTDGIVRIAVIGGINEGKGLNILKEMSRLAQQQNLPVQIVIIGYTSEYLVADNVTITGRYRREDLPELMRKHQIDLVLIPSVWPETFSYTTQEAITMQMPLAVFDLGAPAERVRHYEKGLVISRMDAATALDEIQQFVLKKGFLHG